MFLFSANVFAVKNYSDDFKILEFADTLYQDEKYDKSEIEYLKIKDHEDDYINAYAYFGLGSSTYWNFKYEESEKHYKYLIKNKKLFSKIVGYDKINLYNNLAYIYSELNNLPYSFKYYNSVFEEYEKTLPYQYNNQDGYCLATYNIAWAFFFGDGISQDYLKAHKYFLDSSSTCEDEESMNYIGWMYEEGYGVEQNFEKAAEWYQRSMDHNGYYGKINLAFLLMNGFGIEKNVDLAKQYYDEILKGDYEYWAKEDLLITAKEYVDTLEFTEGSKEKNIEYVESYVCKEINRDAQKGRNISLSFQKCLNEADNGNSTAQYHLGTFYENGIGTVRNYNIAAEWYYKSSVNNEISTFQLAKLIQSGRTDKFTMDTAIKLFYTLKDNPLNEKNDSNYVVESTFELGSIYLHGIGIKRDLDKAKLLFEEVAKYKDHNLNQAALNQIDNIKALSANFAIENKIFRYFPAQFEGKFYWENSTEITHINDFFLDDVKQVGTTNFTLSGYYTDTLGIKVDIKAFLNTNLRSMEIWESNPRNMETDDLLTDEEFILDGSHIGFFNEDYSSLNSFWIPFSAGSRGILQIQRTEKYQTQTSDDIIKESIVFGDYYALIIGNNNYDNLNPLDTAIADANAVAAVLENKYGFYIIDVITDGNYKKIVSTLNSLKQKLKPSDNLLIYYAGHGYAEGTTGYWLPIDADDPSLEDDTNWISDDRLTRIISKIPAKHILVVADSCYSGSIMRGSSFISRNTKNNISHYRNLLNKKTRRAFTSGANQPVLDGGGQGHSIFARSFLDILSENENILETSYIYSQIKTIISNKFDQIPQYDLIPKSGDEGGDFIFVPN